MKTLVALLFAAVAALMIGAALLRAKAETNAVSVILGTQVTTNVAALREVRIAFDAGSAPVTSVTYAFESITPLGTVVVGSTNIPIDWPALTNRYPEALVILERMRTDAAARFASTNAP